MIKIVLILSLLISGLTAADTNDGNWPPGFADPVRRERATFDDLYNTYWKFRFEQICKTQPGEKESNYVLEKMQSLSRADIKRKGPPGQNSDDGQREYDALLNEMRQTWLSWRDEWQTALKGEAIFDLHDMFWKVKMVILVDAILAAKSWDEFNHVRWEYFREGDPNGVSSGTKARLAAELAKLEAALHKAEQAHGLKPSEPRKWSW